MAPAFQFFPPEDIQGPLKAEAEASSEKGQSAYGLLPSGAQYSVNMPGPKILITIPSCWERGTLG